MSAASAIRALGVHAVRGVVSVVGVAFMACAEAGSSGHDSVADASPTCSDVSFESAQLWPSRNILAPPDCSAPAESSFPDQCACAALACDTGETCVLVDQFSDPGMGGPDTILQLARSERQPLCLLGSMWTSVV